MHPKTLDAAPGLAAAIPGVGGRCGRAPVSRRWRHGGRPDRHLGVGGRVAGRVGGGGGRRGRPGGVAPVVLTPAGAVVARAELSGRGSLEPAARQIPAAEGRSAPAWDGLGSAPATPARTEPGISATGCDSATFSPCRLRLRCRRPDRSGQFSPRNDLTERPTHSAAAFLAPDPAGRGRTQALDERADVGAAVGRVMAAALLGTLHVVRRLGRGARTCAGPRAIAGAWIEAGPLLGAVAVSAASRSGAAASRAVSGREAEQPCARSR